MKHVIYWCAPKRWEKITDSTLNKEWNKLYEVLEYEEEENYENLVETAKGIPGCGGIEDSEINEWPILLQQTVK